MQTIMSLHSKVMQFLSAYYHNAKENYWKPILQRFNQIPNLADKVVLITGGAGHIGRVFAKYFLENGAKVCILDIDSNKGREVEKELRIEFGNKVIFALCDVTDDIGFREVFQICKTTLGGIDIVINNAAIGTEVDWKRTVDVDLGGVIRGTELAIEFMSKENGHNGGRVINISTKVVYKALQFPYGPFYGSAKSGVITYTRMAGNKFHVNFHGVTVQCLCLTLMDTPFINQVVDKPYTKHAGEALQKLIDSKIMPKLQIKEVLPGLAKLICDNKEGAVLLVNGVQDFIYIDPTYPL